MTGHGTEFPRKMEQAITALLTHGVEEAARLTGIGPRTLCRWMRDPAFDAAYRAAKRAALQQTLGRLRQGANAAAAMMLKIMIDPGGRASTRFKAATLVLGHAQDAIEIEDFGADVAELERAASASRTRIAGHGAKFGRKKQQAIAALFTQRSIAEAACVAGISTQTLYRWMSDPEFQAEYRAAGRAVFAQAMTLLQRGASTAATTIQNFSVDLRLPAATRLKADQYILSHAKAFEKKDLGARVAEAEGAGGSAGSGEPGTAPKIIGRNLHQRLQRLKTLLLQAKGPGIRIELVQARDGRPAGPIAVREPDGRRVWWKPPEGSREGEPAPADAPPETDGNPFERPREAA
jgi:hypothetical protein